MLVGLGGGFISLSFLSFFLDLMTLMTLRGLRVFVVSFPPP